MPVVGKNNYYILHHLLLWSHSQTKLLLMSVSAEPVVVGNFPQISKIISRNFKKPWGFWEGTSHFLEKKMRSFFFPEKRIFDYALQINYLNLVHWISKLYHCNNLVLGWLVKNLLMPGNSTLMPLFLEHSCIHLFIHSTNIFEHRL